MVVVLKVKFRYIAHVTCPLDTPPQKISNKVQRSSIRDSIFFLFAAFNSTTWIFTGN